MTGHKAIGIAQPSSRADMLDIKKGKYNKQEHFRLDERELGTRKDCRNINWLRGKVERHWDTAEAFSESIRFLFSEFNTSFAVMVNDKFSAINYYVPEDRCGDTSEPLVDLLRSTLSFSPSNVEEVEICEFSILVWLKDNGTANPYVFQFLNVKELT